MSLALLIPQGLAKTETRMRWIALHVVVAVAYVVYVAISLGLSQLLQRLYPVMRLSHRVEKRLENSLLPQIMYLLLRRFAIVSNMTSFRIDKYEVKTHKLCFLFGTMIASRVYPCVIPSNTLSKMFFRRTNVSDRPCRCIIVIVIYKEARNVHNGCGSQEVWPWSQAAETHYLMFSSESDPRVQVNITICRNQRSEVKSTVADENSSTTAINWQFWISFTIYGNLSTGNLRIRRGLVCAWITRP